MDHFSNHAMYKHFSSFQDESTAKNMERTMSILNGEQQYKPCALFFFRWFCFCRRCCCKFIALAIVQNNFENVKTGAFTNRFNNIPCYHFIVILLFYILLFALCFFFIPFFIIDRHEAYSSMRCALCIIHYTLCMFCFLEAVGTHKKQASQTIFFLLAFIILIELNWEVVVSFFFFKKISVEHVLPITPIFGENFDIL